MYDRLSPAVQKFVDGLTATYRQVGFHKQAKENGFRLVEGPRGHPDNVIADDAEGYVAVQ